jgi:hypothetical protein
VIVISTEPDEGFSGKLCNSCGSTAEIHLGKAAPVAPIFGFLWFCLVVGEANFVLEMKTTSSCWYEGYILRLAGMKDIFSVELPMLATGGTRY